MKPKISKKEAKAKKLLTTPDSFWKKWVNSIDRVKVISLIQKYIEEDWNLINKIETTEKMKKHMKATFLNSYFNDLYEAILKNS